MLLPTIKEWNKTKNQVNTGWIKYRMRCDNVIYSSVCKVLLSNTLWYVQADCWIKQNRKLSIAKDDE